MFLPKCGAVSLHLHLQFYIRRNNPENRYSQNGEVSEQFKNGVLLYSCRQVKMNIFGFGCHPGLPECMVLTKARKTIAVALFPCFSIFRHFCRLAFQRIRLSVNVVNMKHYLQQLLCVPMKMF